LGGGGCARFSPGVTGGGPGDRASFLLREVVLRGQADDLLRISTGFGAPIDRRDHQAVSVVVEKSRREREAPAHVVEGVVSHHVELLQSESADGCLLVLVLDHRIEPLLHRVYPVHRAAHSAQDVPFLPIAAQDHVFLTQPSKAQGQEQDDQERQQRERCHACERECDLIEGEVRHGGPSYTRHMRPEELKSLLRGIAEGEISIEDATRTLAALPVEDIDLARLDIHRELRQGMPEAIYAEGKTTEQVAKIAETLLGSNTGAVIATRVPAGMARELTARFPDCVHHGQARLVVFREQPDMALGEIAVVCAGTSDLGVAEEAAIVAEAGGARVDRISDVGVAGIHRLLGVQDRLHAADVVIVVAGMEGALASLVGGIASAPVVAVPTSVGYGASFEGLAALLAMLSSCAAGVAVMNIDNGFGAAMFALRTLRTAAR